MKIESLNMELTATIPADIEALVALIDRHELIREALTTRGEAIIAYQETRECYTLRVVDNTVTVAEHWVTENYDLFRRPDTLVIEEGFCHTGDAADTTEKLLDPEYLADYNFADSKGAKRCGCYYCGAIYEGNKIKRGIYEGRVDIRGTAMCPECEMSTVIVEKDDVKVTENNLWRWFRGVFGLMELPQYHGEIR